MARALLCDICRKPTEAIVAKLYYSPIRRGVKSHHASYNRHLDVGSCCENKLLNGFNWRDRTTAKQYHESRKNGQ